MVFSTEIPIHRERSIDDFMNLLRKYISGSPHYKIAAEDVPQAQFGESREHKGAHCSLSVAAVQEGPSQIVGLKVKQAEEQRLEWIAEIVGNWSPKDIWVSVRVHRDAIQDPVNLPDAQKPYIIQQLFSELGTGEDAGIVVIDEARRLGEQDLELTARLMLGQQGNRLPLVFVSLDFQGQYNVNSLALAKDLAGMAHVAYEADRTFSRRLMRMVDGWNVYGGVIAVYWPDGTSRQRFHPRDYQNAYDLQQEIYRYVRDSLANLRPIKQRTWNYLKEVLSRRLLDETRARLSEEAKEFADLYDEELLLKTRELEEAEAEIRRLTAALRFSEGNWTAQEPSRERVILERGKEAAFYPDEFKEVILRVFDRYLESHQQSDHRAVHVIESLKEANKVSLWESEKIQSEIKSILKDYRGMDAKIRRRLKALGFSIDGGGKHYEIMYNQDKRYCFTLAKTPSDHRSGDNIAGTINRKLFK